MKKILGVFFIILVFCAGVFSAETRVVNAGEFVFKLSLIKKYKDINHNIFALSKIREQAKNLPDKDKNIIQKYVYGAVRGENTFLLINCYLRNNLQDYIPKKEITTPLKCRLDFYSKALRESISGAKLPRNMILYKGIEDKEVRRIFKSKKIDNVINSAVSQENLEKLRTALIDAEFEEKGFILTTYDKNYVKSGKFIFEICAPKNLQAVLLDDLNKTSKKEILINKQSYWKVADIKINTLKDKQFYTVKLKFVKKP